MEDNNNNNKNILSVSQLNEYVKVLLDSDRMLSSIYIRGEISNFTKHYKTGHLYFTLKDDGGLLRTVMFSFNASKLMFDPENGMKVIAHGRIAAFVRDGQYQLYADSLEPDGIGSLFVAYNQLKNRLEAEGLFAKEKKRPVPKIPTCIGVITSPTGAAVRDIMNILGRRFPYAKVILYPSLVQGPGAAKQLTGAVDCFSKSKTADVVIIGRGGGSIEDLWAFNDESLARAVRSCSVPVISAVGHETDFTICDFAADLRAPTPSAAAELAVPDTFDLQRKINNITVRMALILDRNIKIDRELLTRCSHSRALTAPTAYIDDRRMAAFNLSRRLDSAIKLNLTGCRSAFRECNAKLSALDPLSVLSRGYSAVFDGNGNVVKSIAQLEIGDDFSFRTYDGTVWGNVKSKKGKSDKSSKKS